VQHRWCGSNLGGFFTGTRAAASSALAVPVPSAFHSPQFPVSPTLWRRLARCLFLGVPRPSSIPTAASGAADSWRWTAAFPTLPTTCSP